MVNPLLPNSALLRCRHLRIEPNLVTIVVDTTTASGICPLCGRPSERVHSRYSRTLADLPWQGRTVRWCLEVRKFFCDTASCSRRIFAERLPKIAAAYARQSCRLNEALSWIAFACGGEVGARLATRLGMPTSPDTQLRRIRSTSVQYHSSPRVLGVDDWAVRRGRRYGTILCDLEEHRPVDVLDERSAESLSAWLQGHPGVQIITRDRAGCYARGASSGAPHAIQVADRWHLLHNLREALVRLLDRHHRELRTVARAVTPAQIPRAPPSPDTPADGPPSRAQQLRLDRRARRRRRYEQVMELHRQGISLRAIVKRLGLSRRTVRRFVCAGAFPERADRQYHSRVDAFTEYLERRWEEGCHNAVQLAHELSTQGFDGSYDIVRRRVADWRRHRRATSARDQGSSVATAAVKTPSSNRVSWLLLKDDGDVSPEDRAFVDALWRRCPRLKAAACLARAFAQMGREHKAEELDNWIARTHESGVPRELRAFADGLNSDYAAVRAALALKWSNGQLEGQVNRLKLLKRQMYGRANFDLLRQRVLYTG